MGKSEWLLLIAIVVPVLGVLVVSAITASIAVRSGRPNLKLVFTLDPKLGLSRHALFWAAMFVPVGWFLIFGIYAWLGCSGCSIALNAEGFSEFIRISKLPIALLSLALPLTLLVSYLYSTEQTAKQLRKNEHENFYMHRREFVSYFECIEPVVLFGVVEVKYNIAPRTHGRLFKGAPEEGIPILDYKQVDKLIGYLFELERFLVVTIDSDDLESASKAYYDFCRIINPIISFFNISDLQSHIQGCRCSLSLNGVGFYSVGSTGMDAFVAYECVRVYLTNVVYFAGYPPGIVSMEKLSVSSRNVEEKRLMSFMEDRFKKVMLSMK